MSAIGRQLEEARGCLGVSLRDAAESTKILVEYLEYFEKGDFTFELPEVYKRGFLLLYARYLKLDDQAIALEYDKSVGQSSFSEGGEGSLFAGDEGNVKEAEEVSFSRKIGSGIGKDAFENRRVQMVMGGAVVSLVILLLVFLVVLLRPSQEDVSGNVDLTEALLTEKVEEVEKAPVLPIERNAIVLIASSDCEDVLVEQLKDGTLLFRGSLNQGDRLELERKGNVVVKSKTIGLISVEVKGEVFSNNATGLGAWYFNLQGPYDPSESEEE